MRVLFVCCCRNFIFFQNSIFGTNTSNRAWVWRYSQDIDQLLCVKGMVTRCSSIIPDLKQAFFRCYVCSHTLDVLLDRGRIEEPRSCPQCQTLASMELIHNRYMHRFMFKLKIGLYCDFGTNSVWRCLNSLVLHSYLTLLHLFLLLLCTDACSRTSS